MIVNGFEDILNEFLHVTLLPTLIGVFFELVADSTLATSSVSLHVLAG